MQTDKDFYARLTPIFCEVFDDDITLRPDMTAADVATWDSLSNIRLFVSIEEAFNIRFDSSEIGSLKNVGELVEVLKAHLSS